MLKLTPSLKKISYRQKKRSKNDGFAMFYGYFRTTCIRKSILCLSWSRFVFHLFFGTSSFFALRLILNCASPQMRVEPCGLMRTIHRLPIVQENTLSFIEPVTTLAMTGTVGETSLIHSSRGALGTTLKLAR